MLIEFSVENFLSFKDKVTLSMVASKDKDLKENVVFGVQGGKIDLIKSAVIYGANASGKSNLLSAMQFMRRFIINPGKLTPPEGSIERKPFKFNEATASLSSTFETIFLLEDIQYQYGFSIDNARVTREWLYSYPKKQLRKLFLREFVDGKESFNFGAHWPGEGKNLVKVTPPKALFISISSQLNNPLAQKIQNWFLLNLMFPQEMRLGWSGFNFTSKYAMDLPEEKKSILNFLRQADSGISDFEIEAIPLVKSKMLAPLSEEDKKYFENISNKVGLSETYEIMTIHNGTDINGNAKKVSIEFDEESEGTKQFYFLSAPVILCIQKGGTLVVDELDVRLHPVLARWVVEIFNSPITNPKCSQLIFTTHNSSLLDRKLLRRDQIWFTEKTPQGATDLYSLWEFKARKDENFEKWYLAGKYGAIPFLGDISGLTNEC